MCAGHFDFWDFLSPLANENARSKTLPKWKCPTVFWKFHDPPLHPSTNVNDSSEMADSIGHCQWRRRSGEAYCDVHTYLITTASLAMIKNDTVCGTSSRISPHFMWVPPPPQKKAFLFFTTFNTHWGCLSNAFLSQWQASHANERVACCGMCVGRGPSSETPRSEDSHRYIIVHVVDCTCVSSKTVKERQSS